VGQAVREKLGTYQLLDEVISYTLSLDK